MIQYRHAKPHEVTAGAVMWIPPEFTNVLSTDPRAATGMVMVRILDPGHGVAPSVVPSDTPRNEPRPFMVTFSVLGSSLERAEIGVTGADSFFIQLGAGGDDPTKPTSVQQSPDKPRTQIAYPNGIDASQVHAAPAAAVSARPATMYADSATWQLQCPTCPLSVDGPQMVCCWGKRLPDGAFMLEGKCMHNSGMRKRDGAPADQLLTGCTYSGVDHESD